jgi:predicted HTH domain antitoxin
MLGMTLVIDDEILRKVSPQARIELACRLYEAGQLSKLAASKLCNLDRVAFESELQARSIDVFRYGADELDEDMKTLDRVLRKP